MNEAAGNFARCDVLVSRPNSNRISVLRYGQAAKAVNLSSVWQGTSSFSDLCRNRSGSPLPGPLRLVCIFFLVLFPCSFASAAPLLRANLDISREGYFVLSWEHPANASPDLTLQQSLHADFSSELEQWPVNQASQFTQSGLTDGLYYYRLADESSVSNVVQVQVQHHALSRALFFFSLGAVLFILLVVILLHGRRQHPQD